MKEPRAIEEFLKTIEPNYNRALTKLRDGGIDRDTVYTVAGFAAYVAACSPAAMRIHAEMLRAQTEATARVIDGAGLIPKAPKELGSKTLTELLDEGTVRLKIDSKYPQALGIDTIMSRTITFGNFKWDVLRNKEVESPFFTSDYPVAIEKTMDPRILNRIVPMAPDIAVRIKPNLEFDREKADLNFEHFSYAIRDVTHGQIRHVNQLLVRCAERNVFYSEERPWSQEFVNKNRRYRIEAINSQLPTARGYVTVSTQRIQPWNAATN